MTRIKSEAIVFLRECPSDGKSYDNQCARCGSSCDFVKCENCDEDGFVDHDCGEDCCCCADPEPNVVCDYCNGRGGYWACLSDAEYCEANPLPGRESINRGVLEWYELPAKGTA